VKAMASCFCCILISYLSIVYGHGDGDGDSCMRGWLGMETILKLFAGIGVWMGIRVSGTVGMGINISPRAAL